MKPGDVVLYVETPEAAHPALVLGVNYPQPSEPPVLSLVFVPQHKDAKGGDLAPDPRLEGNDWHTAVTRRGGVRHGTHDSKAGKSLYDYWCNPGEEVDIEVLHTLRQQDLADAATLTDPGLSPTAPLSAAPPAHAPEAELPPDEPALRSGPALANDDPST